MVKLKFVFSILIICSCAEVYLLFCCFFFEFLDRVLSKCFFKSIHRHFEVQFFCSVNAISLNCISGLSAIFRFL